jgi:anaerobic ribonucleoside-triphosphate reductase activating protein
LRYAQIRDSDISNGEGVGIALFVQGCHFHCKNCFNQETWDFNGGTEWNQKTLNNFLELASPSYIKRISLLGGEPLADENVSDVLRLVQEIKEKFLDKSIWLYSGYIWENIFSQPNQVCLDCLDINKIQRQEIIKLCDVLVDGQYIDELRDITLAFRGSKNQRIIDIKKSLKENRVILYME